MATGRGRGNDVVVLRGGSSGGGESRLLAFSRCFAVTTTVAASSYVFCKGTNHECAGSMDGWLEGEREDELIAGAATAAHGAQVCPMTVRPMIGCVVRSSESVTSGSE